MKAPRIPVLTFFGILFLVVGSLQASPESLVRIWEVTELAVNGERDGGEEGGYWILREDGSFSIIKRGRKTDGNWEIDAEKSILHFSIDGQVVMEGTYVLDARLLVVSIADGEDKVRFSLKDSGLEDLSLIHI